MKHIATRRPWNSALRRTLLASVLLSLVPLAAPAAPYPGPNPASLHALVEAENYDTDGFNDLTPGNGGGVYRSDAVDITNTVADGGSAYAVTDMQTGEWLSYTVNVPYTGTYRLAARLKPLTTTGPATLTIEIPQDAVSVTVNTATNNTNWQSRAVSGTYVNLTAGTRTVKVSVTNAGDGLHFNYLLCQFWDGLAAQEPFPDPAAPHPIPGVIEFENFDAGEPAAATEQTEASYKDTSNYSNGHAYRATDVDVQSTFEGLIVGWVAAGEWLEYTVHVTESGLYKVEIRLSTSYADPAVLTNLKKCRLLLDGADITGEIIVPNMLRYASGYSTGKYGTIWVVTNQPLPTGQHVLRFEALQNGDYNLKSMRFARVGSEPSTGDVGWWRFDADGREAGQAATAFVDQSVNHNNATVSGGPVYSNGIPSLGHSSNTSSNGTNETTRPNHPVHSGYLNRLSMDFEADSKQYASVPHGPSLNIGDSSFTIEAWVKGENNASTMLPADRRWVVQKKAAGADDGATDYALLAGGSDLAANGTWGKTAGANGEEIVLLFGTGSGVQTAVSTFQVFNDGKWHYIAASYNAARKEVIFIKNGKAEVVSDVNRAPAVANTGPLWIAGHSGASGVDQTFDGKIDELRISTYALAGTPGNTGTPSATPWFWENDGTSPPDGMFTPAGVQPFAVRRKDCYVDNVRSFWDIVSVAGEPGNHALRLYDSDDLDDGYLFWDNVGPNNLPDEASTPQDMAQGVTFQMRFKINAFRDNGNTISAQNRVKFLRFISNLSGTTTANARLNWELGYADDAAKTGVALWSGDPILDVNNDGILTESGDSSGKWNSGNLADGQWHTLHAVAYVDAAAGGVRHRTWLDWSPSSPAVDEEWVSKQMDLTYDPILGFNDHIHPHQWTTDMLVDFIRMSGAGSWGPDGTLYTTFPEVCDNGIDDDGDTRTDCADSECVITRVCCPDPVYDADRDGDVDAADFGVLQACWTGPADPYNQWPGRPDTCKCMGIPTGDSDLDQADLDRFLDCAQGPGVLASPACDD